MYSIWRFFFLVDVTANARKLLINTPPDAWPQGEPKLKINALSIETGDNKGMSQCTSFVLNPY